jgi:hypothetical protein
VREEWPECLPSQQRCLDNLHQTCRTAGELTRVETEDCAARGLVCVPDRWCILCRPGDLRCTADSLGVERCRMDGAAWEPSELCNVERGEACRGGRCVSLCNSDEFQNTYYGCQYYGVDLDNIVEGGGRSAASQQYAIVVSNPDPVLTVRVEIHRNTAAVGMPPNLDRVASAVIPPRDLEVFELPAREVDCSTVAGLNDGTGTCLSSRAYRVTSNFPVVAYQFNPLDNVNVFSNDASLLLPVNSLGSAYRFIGYPQQFSRTENPDTNGREEIRSYMTLVGTAPGTRVQITPTADIIPGGPLMTRQPRGRMFEVTLGPFDVLNLETGAFLADFTGSSIVSNNPVALFSGTECSDVPFWMSSGDRQPACDHIEDQVFPLATAGTHFVASRTPPRTPAVRAAGALVTVVNEPEWFRVLNASSRTVNVTTTLPTDISRPESQPVAFALEEGEHRDIRGLADFQIDTDGPVMVAQLMGSQQTTGLPFTLPGGDPALIMVPPIEQWRTDYVFLTPTKYAFDFVQMTARPDVRVFLDNTPVDDFADCVRSRSDGCIETPRHRCPPPVFVTYRCQVSFPQIDMAQNPPAVTNGRQNDGVHVVRSEFPPGRTPEGVQVIVSGFDRYVSYAYAGGTNVRPLR